MVDEIKSGNVTFEEAAKELARMCDCGIFNTFRAEKILKKLIETL